MWPGSSLSLARRLKVSQNMSEWLVALQFIFKGLLITQLSLSLCFILKFPLLATLVCRKVGIFLLFLWAFSLIKIKCVHSCNLICPLQWKSMLRALASQAAEVLFCSLCPLCVHLSIWPFITHVFWCFWSISETSAPLQTIYRLVFSFPVCLLENSRGWFFVLFLFFLWPGE